MYRHLLRMLALVLGLGIAAPVGAADAFSPITLPQSPPSYTIGNFPAMGQWWNLSCEYAATSAATAYVGRPISQGEFAQEIGFNANPFKGFRGNLSGPWGGTWDYGVYAEPILSVLIAHGYQTSYTFRGDTTMLRDAVSHNRPVVVWINGTWGYAPKYYEQSDGDTYLLVPYEHAVTVYGYNESGVQIMDPAYGSYYSASWQSFMNTWMQLDGMALAVGI